MKIEEILAVKHLSVEFQTSDGKKTSSKGRLFVVKARGGPCSCWRVRMWKDCTVPINFEITAKECVCDRRSPHGLALAIITPKWMTYLLNKDETVVADFARFGFKCDGYSRSR